MNTQTEQVTYNTKEKKPVQTNISQKRKNIISE